MSLQVNDGIQNNSPKSLDAKYTKTVGGASVPYDSVEEVHTLIPVDYRSVGLTVLVRDSAEGPVEYWWKDATQNNDLIRKRNNTAGTTYTAGNGIGIANSVITNTLPDRTVAIAAGTGLSVSGTYPNFTLANTQPDRIVGITQGQGILVGGTYPNFTIGNTAPDQVVNIAAGTGISVSGTYPSFTITNTGNGTGTTTTVTIPPGFIYFDDFSGTTDSQKIASMNAWLLSRGSGPSLAVLFDARVYNFSTPIILYSKMTLVGSKGSPAREFGNGTVLNYQGPAGTSMFAFPPTGQAQPGGQSYPNAFAPRDISVSHIEMTGGSTVHCLPFNTTLTSAKVIWFTNFHNCAWNGFDTIWTGFQDGCSISGETYVEAFSGVSGNPFTFNGADNDFFTSGQTFISSEMPAFINSGRPMVELNMSQSRLGRLFATPYATSYPILISGGWSLFVDGAAFDAQDSSPIYGPALRITGGEGITITNCSFKGYMSNPTLASGGANSNKGWIHMSGGKGITLIGNVFARVGDSLPAETVPILHTTAAITKANTVKWGYNTYHNWTGSPVLQNTNAGIIHKTDPEPIITT